MQKIDKVKLDWMYAKDVAEWGGLENTDILIMEYALSVAGKNLTKY